jgi:hypothetical protein
MQWRRPCTPNEVNYRVHESSLHRGRLLYLDRSVRAMILVRAPHQFAFCEEAHYSPISLMSLLRRYRLPEGCALVPASSVARSLARTAGGLSVAILVSVMRQPPDSACRLDAPLSNERQTCTAERSNFYPRCGQIRLGATCKPRTVAFVIRCSHKRAANSPLALIAPGNRVRYIINQPQLPFTSQSAHLGHLLVEAE